MSYDTKCEDLAREFLQGWRRADAVDALAAKLAQHIQDAIEAWLNDMERTEPKSEGQ